MKNNFLNWLNNNPEIYFYEKAVKRVFKYIRNHYNINPNNDLEAIPFFEIYMINNIEKKLEFVFKINYTNEKSIEFELYSFILNDKLHFLTAYGDQTEDFDMYNFCKVWRFQENKKKKLKIKNEIKETEESDEIVELEDEIIEEFDSFNDYDF